MLVSVWGRTICIITSADSSNIFASVGPFQHFYQCGSSNIFASVGPSNISTSVEAPIFLATHGSTVVFTNKRSQAKVYTVEEPAHRTCQK